ncbi:unknown [Eggerthella sp. CAG:209]|nr:unknown [Eggerthella sp. CAG:209]
MACDGKGAVAVHREGKHAINELVTGRRFFLFKGVRAAHNQLRIERGFTVRSCDQGLCFSGSVGKDAALCRCHAEPSALHGGCIGAFCLLSHCHRNRIIGRNNERSSVLGVAAIIDLPAHRHFAYNGYGTISGNLNLERIRKKLVASRRLGLGDGVFLTSLEHRGQRLSKAVTVGGKGFYLRFCLSCEHALDLELGTVHGAVACTVRSHLLDGNLDRIVGGRNGDVAFTRHSIARDGFALRNDGPIG